MDFFSEEKKGFSPTPPGNTGSNGVLRKESFTKRLFGTAVATFGGPVGGTVPVPLHTLFFRRVYPSNLPSAILNPDFKSSRIHCKAPNVASSKAFNMF